MDKPKSTKEQILKNVKNKIEKKETSFKVHTMPEKFLNLRPSIRFGKISKGKGKPMGMKRNLLVGLIIIIVLGGLMSLAAWLFLRSVGPAASPEPTLPVFNNPPGPAPVEEDPSNAGNNIKPEPNENELLTDTSTWQTYTNDSYEYTLKYPKSWTYNEVLAESSSIMHSLRFSFENQSNIFQVLVHENTERIALSSWLNARGVNLADLQSFTLSNQPSYIYQTENSDTYKVFSDYNYRFYEIILTDTEELSMTKANDNLLVNFKFTGTPLPPIDPEENEIEFPPATDSDSDGLTDAEEILFGTNSNLSDTDGDSYTDSEEIANLYDPTVAGAARLYESSLVSTYVNTEYNYNLLIPATWQVKGQGNSVIFQDSEGEFFQIFIESSAPHSDIITWYQVNISEYIGDLTSVEINEIPAIKTADGLRVYFIFGDNVYSIIYNIGLRDDANFMATFDMIQKSFKIMSS